MFDFSIFLINFISLFYDKLTTSLVLLPRRAIPAFNANLEVSNFYTIVPNRQQSEHILCINVLYFGAVS